jgi:signal transduction histidine kinase
MDTEKMKQTILNLLANAIDFVPEGGKIKLVTRHVKEKGKSSFVRIEVQDNGLGIPRSMIDKVFDPYFTTKHKSSMHKGTGLGLFISHQNMQDHGGTIEVNSKVDEGTTFILTLPENHSFDPQQKDMS